MNWNAKINQYLTANGSISLQSIYDLLLPKSTENRGCAFLAAYIEDRNKLMALKGPVQKLVGSIGDVFGSNDSIAAKAESLLGIRIAAIVNPNGEETRSLRGLELRLATLLVCQEATKGNNVVSYLKALIEAFQQYFATAGWQECNVFKANAFNGKDPLKSAAWLALHAAGDKSQDVANAILDAMKQMQPPVSFLDPAVAFVTDTIALALQCKGLQAGNRDQHTLPAWGLGTTWLLIGLQGPSKSQGPSKPSGMLLKLQLETVATSDNDNTIGSCYPHPMLAAHTRIEDSFQNAIRNSWLSVNPGAEHVWKYDLRWALTVMEQEGHNELRRIPLSAPFTGESGTIAFAAAIESILKQQTLRMDAAVTAQFDLNTVKDETGKIDVNKLSKQTALSVVGLIDQKDAALNWDNTESSEPAKQIKEIVVANNQQSQLPTRRTRIEKKKFDSAYSYLTEFENAIKEYALKIATLWKWNKQQEIEKDQTRKNADDEQLDCYVPPQLEWETEPEPEALADFPRRPAEEPHLLRRKGTGEQDGWHREDLPLPRESQVMAVYKRLRKESKWLVLMDGAGAGKTVLSKRLAFEISDSKSSAEQPIMVFRWGKKFPMSVFDKLVDVLKDDSQLKNIESDETKRVNLLKYAIDNRRIVMIIDGWDEYTPTERQTIVSLLDPNDSSGADENAKDLQKVTWIFTGRQNAIKNIRSETHLFGDDRFLRLRIKPFSEDLQDEYFEKFPIANMPVGSSWRDTLANPNDPKNNDFLGLPRTLREIRSLIELALDMGNPLPKFESLSDLFLQSARPLLQQALDRTKISSLEAQDTLVIDISYPDAKLKLLERVLSTIAFQMAIQEFTQQVVAKVGESIETTITNLKIAARNRCADLSDNHWNWAVQRLDKIATNHSSTTESFEKSSVAFQNRGVFEMHCARFLVEYATDADLQEAWAHIGDEEWRDIWKHAIEMPQFDNDTELGAGEQKYKDAVRTLFKMPQSKSKQRRPTELMWMAEQWIESQVKKGKVVLDGFSQRLREQLAAKFQAILNSPSDKQSIANHLLWQDNEKTKSQFVLIGDDSAGSQRLKGDTWGKGVYGMHRYQITNEQFQLFDPAQNDAHRFCKNPKWPATMVSWFDAYWYCVWVGEVDCGHCHDRGKSEETNAPSYGKFQVVLTCEVKWEYACRAGSKGEYCLGVDGVEVTKVKLAKYAVYDSEHPEVVGSKLPNKWGLYDMLGNVWEWCDGYGIDFGSQRMDRGGSWDSYAEDCMSADRDYNKPVRRNHYLGFRASISRSGGVAGGEKQAAEPSSVGTEGATAEQRPEMPLLDGSART